MHLLRHNVDVMYVEKNIYDMLLGTLLDTKDKIKDTLKGNCELMLMRLRKNFILYLKVIIGMNFLQCVAH